MSQPARQSGTINRTSHSLKRRRALYEGSDVIWTVDEDGAEHQWIPVSIDKYQQVNKIGEGTYGAVYRSKAPSGVYVALKKVRMENEKEGFPITAIREIKILKALDHPNIVPLMDVVTSTSRKKQQSWDSQSAIGADSTDVYMVFEYLDHDLAGIMANPEVQLKEKHIKYYMQQILEALYYCHEKCNIIHRDIKGSNVLINNNGEVKLADFGLARQFHPTEDRDYTNRVVTLWYRAPELLFGEKKYGPAIDMWSLGCVFAEMIFGKPTFPAEKEQEAIVLICKLVGSPNESNYPVSRLPFKFAKQYPRQLAQRYEKLKKQSPLAFDLLDKLLVLDPRNRMTAAQALEHEYFHSEPLPEELQLDHIEPSHDYESRLREREKKRQRVTHVTRRDQHHHAHAGERRDFPNGHQQRGHTYNEHSSRPRHPSQGSHGDNRHRSHDPHHYAQHRSRSGHYDRGAPP
eukprot:257008_1